MAINVSDAVTSLRRRAEVYDNAEETSWIAFPSEKRLILDGNETGFWYAGCSLMTLG